MPGLAGTGLWCYNSQLTERESKTGSNTQREREREREREHATWQMINACRCIFSATLLRRSLIQLIDWLMATKFPTHNDRDNQFTDEMFPQVLVTKKVIVEVPLVGKCIKWNYVIFYATHRNFVMAIYTLNFTVDPDPFFVPSPGFTRPVKSVISLGPIMP